MANILIYNDDKTVKEYLTSVNTPSYDMVNKLTDPDISRVKEVDMKYWIVDEKTVREMTLAEKAVIDQKYLDAKEARLQSLEIDTIVLAKALVKAGIITKTALVNAIKQVI